MFGPEVEREFVSLNAQLDAWAISGWCNPTEQQLLYFLARNGPGVGAIVEIGSFQGRSTICLAAGSKHAGREMVTAIEPFEVCSFDGFVANIARANLSDWVTPIVGLSHQVVRNWDTPIRLLYIDANHSFEAVCQDYLDWAPFVVPGGIIAFHDAIQPNYPGVSAALDAVLDPREWFPSRLLFSIADEGTSGSTDTFSSIVVAQKRTTGAIPEEILSIGEGVYNTMRTMMARQYQLESYARHLESRIGEIESAYESAVTTQERLASAVRNANPFKNRARQLLGKR